MDHGYANHKLKVLLRDLDSFSGEEFWREMSRIAAGATGADHAEGLAAERDALATEVRKLKSRSAWLEGERNTLQRQRAEVVRVLGCDPHHKAVLTAIEALAARFERLYSAASRAHGRMACASLALIRDGEDAYFTLGDVLKEESATSLARLKAQWQAEALESFGIHCRDLAGNAAENGHMAQADAVGDVADDAFERAEELRRQAEEGE